MMHYHIRLAYNNPDKVLPGWWLFQYRGLYHSSKAILKIILTLVYLLHCTEEMVALKLR